MRNKGVISFSRALESAWQRVEIILFRPFDAWKWFVIGFNAFLALLAEGGIAINDPISFNNQTQTYNYQTLPALLHALKQSISWLQSFAVSPWLMLYVVGAFIYLIVWLVLTWVGSRGEFLLLDNIVRNRPAVSWPWHRYARQGNVWFLFHLGLTLLSVIFFLSSVGAFLALNWSWIQAERNPYGSEVAVLACLLLAIFFLWTVYAVVMFLIQSLVLPLYFKQSMSLGAALLAVCRLIVAHPISLVVYLLASFVLAFVGGILTIVVLCLACCLICWLACVPFIGSMLLTFVLCQLILPILIFYRCFQLDCLAQFGPEYDVWTVDVPPTNPGISPQLPPG